jgi:hypothetical protein
MEWIQELRPTNRYHYFDRIRIHVKGSPSPKWLEDLRKECRVEKLGALWSNPAYQKLEIYQPNSEALRLLATLPDNASVACIEVACDVIAPDESSLGNINAAFQHGFLQQHHRTKNATTFVEEDSGSVTGFTSRRNPRRGKRRRGHWFQYYSDRPCKITGELYCFHFEGKYEGAQAVKRLGIYHPRDLENFSFDEYFSKHASKLYCINHDRLGRFDDNRRSRGKRKKSYTGKWNSDRYRGHRIYRILSLDCGKGNSLQTFVDRYGRGPFLEAYDISMFIGTNGSTCS